MSKRILITSLMTLLLASPAIAHKEMGGGTEAGGILFDEYEARGATTLTATVLGTVLRGELNHVLLELPQLADFAVALFEQKQWLLDSRPLAARCRNETSLDVPLRIIACQTRHEVRIAKRTWNRASRLERAKLLLHELIRAAQLRFELDDETVRLAYRALMDPGLTDFAKRERLNTLGYGILFTRSEVSFATRYAEIFILQPMCQATTPAQRARVATRLLRDLPEQIMSLETDSSTTFLIAMRSLVRRFEGMSSRASCDYQAQHVDAQFDAFWREAAPRTWVD